MLFAEGAQKQIFCENVSVARERWAQGTESIKLGNQLLQTLRVRDEVPVSVSMGFTGRWVWVGVRSYPRDCNFRQPGRVTPVSHQHFLAIDLNRLFEIDQVHASLQRSPDHIAIAIIDINVAPSFFPADCSTLVLTHAVLTHHLSILL